nr:MAG TPA: TIP39 peptide [Caudoviricetes sp.]
MRSLLRQPMCQAERPSIYRWRSWYNQYMYRLLQETCHS